MAVRILEGDALTVLRTLPDQSVQCCVTSPPYWGLRDYGVDGQIGLEATPDEYVLRIVEVFQEVRRVLRDDGTLWLNLGDSYAGSGKGPSNNSTLDRPYRGMSNIVGAPNRWLSIPSGVKAKDLVGIPWLCAFALRADGWYLRSDIIWAKNNPMPESVTDRPTKSHEYLFLLAKSDRYFYDADAIKEPHLSLDATAARANQHNKGSKYEARLDLGGDRSRLDFFGEGGRNKRSVWTVSTSPYSEAHFATFPPKLIEPCILAGSARQACEKCGAPWEREIVTTKVRPQSELRGKYAEPGASVKIGGGASTIGHSNWHDGRHDSERQTIGFKPTCECDNSGAARSVVLDPFMGAGTTGLVADRLGRDCIGIELNPKYAEMARDRIRSDNPLFADVDGEEVLMCPVCGPSGCTSPDTHTLRPYRHTRLGGAA